MANLFYAGLQEDNVFAYGNNVYHKYQNVMNPSWCDVLQSWCALQTISEPKTVPEYLNEPLWLNSKLNNGNILIKQWVKQKVYYVSNLFDHDGHFLSFHSFKTKFGIKGTVLDFERVKRAIPLTWKTSINREHKGENKTLFLPASVELLITDKKAASCIYKCLIGIIKPELNYQTKWRSKFPGVDLNWPTINKALFTCTKDTKL